MAGTEAGRHRIETLRWTDEGFGPLVSFGDWLVALMNWEQRFDVSGIGAVERHNETDEVFVLLNGRSVLFIDNDRTIEALEMTPGTVYNVTKGTYHSLIGTRDVKWLIVESNSTTHSNTDHRSLTEAERAALEAQLPSWLRDHNRRGPTG